MLIILEMGRRAHQMQQIGQCYDILANVLTMEYSVDWGLQDVSPVVVYRRMIDWAMEGDVSEQIVQVQCADNVGDRAGGSIASCGNPNTAAG